MLLKSYTSSSIVVIIKRIALYAHRNCSMLPDEPIMPNPKIYITETMVNEYTTEMDLFIKSLEKRDFGEYTCVTENTIGRAEGKIRLSGRFISCLLINLILMQVQASGRYFKSKRT